MQTNTTSARYFPFSLTRRAIAGDDVGAVTYPPAVPLAKRLFDVVFSICALLFFLPVLVAVSGLLLWREGGPVFYIQERVGHGGKLFPCLKFRTMVVDAEAQLAAHLARDPAARAEWAASRKLRNDPRVSCLGRFLRKTSLDELPQFLNVLRGDMSVVGPRPIVAEEAALYREHLIDYKSVRPGLTGVWQVSGRSNTTFEERVQMDVDYVTRWSFGRDLMITVQTIVAVLTQRGAR